jgi:hypothetical protein
VVDELALEQFLAYFPYFEKLKVDLCDLHPVSVSARYQLLNG